MKLPAYGLLLAASACAQSPVSNAGFRIAYVRKIYIEDLGADNAAKLVRDQLTGAIFRKTRLQVESAKADADATLIGTAIVTSGSLHWAVGSAAANSTSASAQLNTGGRTIRITELGLQLTDRDGRILWAFDGSHCLDVTTLVLWGIPKKKTPTTCAVDQLVKAIETDARDDRHRK